MKRVAALYDIHGNLPALEAVLQEVNRAEVELVVIGGDVIPGPMPLECLNCVMNLDVPTRFLLGNGESEVLAALSGEETGNVPKAFRDVVRWNGRQLSEELTAELGHWPLTEIVDIDDLGHVLFCHATPRNNTEIFTHKTDPERLAPAFADLNASLVICGHTHLQFDLTVGDLRIVNAGSVGMPFGATGAHWLLLSPEVELRHTMYDLEKAARSIEETDYPQARDFAGNNVVNSPTAEQILEVYAKAELR